MTTGSTGTRRRTLLQRGFALLAGGAAIASGGRLAAAASPPKTAPATMTLYARKRDVFDRPGGDRIGSLHANVVGAQSPFGVTAASSVEMHTLQLPDGALFALSATASSGEQSMAIVGGTGRFAGKIGSCLSRAIPGDHAADDLRELSITFAG